MGKKPQPSNKPAPDFLVKKNRGVNPRGVSYDRDYNDQMESLKKVGQFAWESLPGIGTAYTIQDIKDELAKEDPNYYMIGALAGAEVIGLIPGLGDAAAELIKKGAKSAGKLGSKIDRAVDQTTALLGGPKAKDVVKNQMAGFTGQNPPTYQKRDTPLSQQQDVELDEFRQPQPTEKTELSRKDILVFRDPIKELAETVTIPKKGLLGSEFLKMVKKNESIADSSLQPQIIDPKRRYTREELLEAIGDDESFPGPNVFRSETFIGEYPGNFRNYQRQSQDAGFLGVGREISYFELPILSRPPSGSEGTGRPFKANSQHFDEDTIAHARGSIVQPADGVTVSFEYEDLIGQKPFLLVEEIQSDLLQKGYAKPGKLSDMAFKKVTEEFSRNTTVTFQEAFGEISKDIKNIFEELDEANIVRPDLVDGFGARDKFQRNAINRGYVLSNELEEVLDKLNVSEGSIETTVMDLTDLARGRMNQFLPIVDADTGAEFSIADFTEKFKKETYVSNKEKTQRFFDKSRELLAKKQIDKEIPFEEFQNLYERYKINQHRLIQGGYHLDNIGLPPITKNKQAVEESFKALIAKAAREGVDKIVIPPAEKIAKARSRTLDPDDKGDRFYRTYVTDLNKVLNDLEKNYPVEVHKNVPMPYDSQVQSETIERGLQTLGYRGEFEAFTVPSSSAEVSIPADMDYATLRQAIDREVHAENLTDEQEQVFRAFAYHNQISFDEVPQVFSEWHVKQADELFKKPWFKEMLPESDTAYGTILDISELVDEFKVEEPRQFFEGGSVRPKLRPGSDRRISPKPRLRPDPERQYGLAEVEARADFDPAMHWNPIARLGFTGFSSDKTGKGNETYPPAFYFPSRMSKKTAIERSISQGIPYDKALTVEPDNIFIAPELTSKRVWAHEMTHRGFDRIIESINTHPEGPAVGAQEFKDKYGEDTFNLLTARTNKSHEGIVEMFDDLEDSVLREAPEEEYLDDSNVDEIKRFQKTAKRKPEDRWQINKDAYKPYIKLMEAAQDMLTKAGEPPKSPDYEESILDKLRIKLGFAEGGTVDMNQQMSFAFADGGLRDDGMRQDPVSGNEVPAGSMANEVRDDIPAQLSEGEYVVPADVVRYYGVKFFEDLRDNAKMGLQDMEARGRIGGEPVPAGGPVNEDDLTPEEMAAIQEMMGMSQGGAILGFDEGGLTDQDILTAGQQAQQNQFTGFPLGATIFPRAGSGRIEAVPTTPTITTEETAESCAAKDMDYDPVTKTCVPRTVAETTPAPSDDDTPAVEPPKWYEKYDYSNPDAVVSKSLKMLGVESGTEEKETQNIAQKILGGIGTGLGSMLESGFLGGIIRQQKVAEVAANAQLLRAQGNTEAAEMLENAIDGYRTKHDIEPGGFFDSTKTLSRQLADRYSDLGFNEEDGTIFKVGATTPTTVTKPQPPKPTTTESEPEPSAARQAQIQRAEDNDWSYDPDPKFYDKEPTGSLSSTVSAANEAAGDSGQVSSTISGAGTSSQQVSGGTQDEQDYLASAAAGNKGGLMNKAATKKKAKRQYKKGGLAGKK